jgi:hypothetical protein
MPRRKLPAAERWTGTHLYKYGSVVDRLESLILHHKIYIPTPAQLNDPNDSRPRLVYLNRRQLVRFMAMHAEQQNPWITAHRPELIARITEVCKGLDTDALFRETVEKMDADLSSRRVYSMSTRWNNLKMWSQYANDHAGYCLEFANDAADWLIGMARMVIYDDSFELDLTLDEHGTAIWYLFKHPDWRCEEEVRIILPQKFGGPEFDLSPNVLTRVILGRNMPPDDVERIREWAARRAPRLDVAVTTYDAFKRTFDVTPLAHR